MWLFQDGLRCISFPSILFYMDTVQTGTKCPSFKGIEEPQRKRNCKSVCLMVISVTKELTVPLSFKYALDGKTVGFFLKISKEIGKAWRKSLTLAKSRSLFSASFQTFCLTARAYLNTQKYGLLCSLNMLSCITKIASKHTKPCNSWHYSCSRSV